MRRFFRRHNRSQRVLLLGLDCASPDHIFNQFAGDLPHLTALRDGGSWGELTSSIPCITIPAWASMTTGRDPGVLGVYGFRNRQGYDYDDLQVVDARAIQHKRVWDVLGACGKTSLIMNVPQTYPVHPAQGNLVSGFLTPGLGAQFAYPAILKNEVLKIAPDYAFDVQGFRTVPRETLLQRLYDLTEIQYRTLLHMLQRKEWDFAMHVNIAMDRLQHAFWRYHDPHHRLHEAHHRFQNVIRDYYKMVDEWIGRVRAALDDVVIIVASDHGVKRMDGAIAINEWLRLNGWLTLKQEPQSILPFNHNDVDWHQTKAWSTGGYYGRIFLNVRGREPHGIIAPEDYDAVLGDLADQIKAIPDDRGQPMATKCFRPQEIYAEVNGIAPDLLVYFGDLYWRAVGSIGYGEHYTLENDIGPDDANHAQQGLFIIYDPDEEGAGNLKQRSLLDIAPTILRKMGCAIPNDMQGTYMGL